MAGPRPIRSALNHESPAYRLVNQAVRGAFVLVGGKELESLTLCTSSRGSKRSSYTPNIRGLPYNFCSTYFQGAI